MRLKRQWLALLGIVLLTAQCAKEPAELKTEKDKVNTASGLASGKALNSKGWKSTLTWW